MLRTMAGLMAVDPGFAAEGVVTGRVSVPSAYYEGDDAVRVFDELARRNVDVLLSPEAQKCFAENQYAGPTNRTVELGPEILVLGRHLDGRARGSGLCLAALGPGRSSSR